MPSSKTPYIFTATQSVADQLGEMSSFLLANYTGLRELCWQVRGFQYAYPSVTVAEMEKKFLAGLPMPGGIDLKRTCIDTTWAEHERAFAKWLLFEVCSLYEGWAEKVCSDIFPPARAETNAKQLQFPVSVRRNGTRGGYVVAVADANSSTSTLIVQEIYPKLRAHTLNRWTKADEHLIAYRLFKECRNALIQSDGRATQEVVDCHASVMGLQSATPNPFRHLFTMPLPALGQPIELVLRDCILLGTVVHRLIVTFDAALSVSSRCESILADRLRAVVASDQSKWRFLPNDPGRHAQRIHRLLAAAKVPEPKSIANVEAWMKATGVL
jgi:hypothetical protein